jgi:hypothetical protein
LLLDGAHEARIVSGTQPGIDVDGLCAPQTAHCLDERVR